MNTTTNAAPRTSRNWNHEPHVDAKGEPTGAIVVGEDWSYTRQVTMINPTERACYPGAFVLHFGAYGWTRLHVYAFTLEEALEACAEWLAKHAPGHIMVEYGEEHMALIREACEEAKLPFPPPDGADLEPYHVAEEAANADLTHTEYGFVTSYEWGVALENPTTAELYAYVTGQ